MELFLAGICIRLHSIYRSWGGAACCMLQWWEARSLAWWEFHSILREKGRQGYLKLFWAQFPLDIHLYYHCIALHVYDSRCLCFRRYYTLHRLTHERVAFSFTKMLLPQTGWAQNFCSTEFSVTHNALYAMYTEQSIECTLTFGCSSSPYYPKTLHFMNFG